MHYTCSVELVLIPYLGHYRLADLDGPPLRAVFAKIAATINSKGQAAVAISAAAPAHRAAGGAEHRGPGRLIGSNPARHIEISGCALTYQVEDLSIEDGGKQVTATRTYRSDRLSEGDAGAGWTSAFSESLSQAGDVATMRFGDGSALSFATDPAAGYTPAPGVSTSFVTGPAGTTVTTPERVGYRFDPAGELVVVALGDDGHELTVARAGGRVSQVTGVSGRHLAYGRVGGQLTAVTDQSGRGVTLAYSGDRLTGVEGLDGQTESYTYDSQGRLTAVTTPEGRAKRDVHDAGPRCHIGVGVGPQRPARLSAGGVFAARPPEPTDASTLSSDAAACPAAPLCEDQHKRFCGSPGVRFPRATRPWRIATFSLENLYETEVGSGRRWLSGSR